MTSIFIAFWALAASALVAALTAWLQFRNWRNQNLVRLRETEQEVALKVVKDFATLISKRLYRQKRFLWAVRDGRTGDGDTDISEYRSVLLEWNDKFREIETRVAYSFDNETMARIENRFQPELVRIHQILVQEKGKPNLANAALLAKAERSLDVLGHESISLTKDLLRRIRGLEFSIFLNKDEISFRNRSNLSIGHLFFRLFGISNKAH